MCRWFSIFFEKPLVRRVNHTYAVALHFMHYNFVRTHKTLRMTPAMAAGLVESPWEVEGIVKLVEKAEDAAPKKRGPYKKKDISK